MVKILFVCLGNICRSPAAEGVMKHLLRRYDLEKKVYCESAGTSAYHCGELPDSRMRGHALRRGLTLDSLARQFEKDDFQKFDYIVTMDRSNYKNVMSLDPSHEFAEKVIPMAHLCHKMSITEVPDPYSGGPEGFEEVLDIVEDGCRGLLDKLGLVNYDDSEK